MLKNWLMMTLTIIFVGLYTSALVGWLRPLADVTMITRLEPIIFVIIGYYFGRLPAQANEKTLKEEIDRQTQKALASQHAKEVAEKESEVMEEKIKNARIALIGSRTQKTNHNGSAQARDENQDQKISDSNVGTAVSILDS